MVFNTKNHLSSACNYWLFHHWFIPLHIVVLYVPSELPFANKNMCHSPTLSRVQDFITSWEEFGNSIIKFLTSDDY